MATISTHRGAAAYRAHNVREEKVASKLGHIDRAKQNITLCDEKPEAAYEKLFGDAVKRYNEKQTRADRKIDDYYKKICHDKKHQPSYEFVVGVYDKINEIPAREQVEVLKEFYERFKADNPNMHVIGAYIHLDEAHPHMHLDYIPVGHGYTRGMDTQVSQERALKEQGYCTRSYSDTALKQWTADVNKTLEDICSEHWIDVEHPQAGKGVEHLNTEAYKAQQELHKTQNAVSVWEEELKTAVDRYNTRRAEQDAELKEHKAVIARYASDAERLRSELKPVTEMPYAVPYQETRKGKVVVEKTDFEQLKKTASAKLYFNNIDRELRKLSYLPDSYELRTERNALYQDNIRLEERVKELDRTEDVYFRVIEKTADYCAEEVLRPIRNRMPFENTMTLDDIVEKVRVKHTEITGIKNLSETYEEAVVRTVDKLNMRAWFSELEKSERDVQFYDEER